MKAFNEMMERREAERKAYDEMMMAKWKTDRKKWKAERKANQEVVARLEAIHDKTDANQMRLET
jgi:ribosomal 30S subunit maturation factor RimM